MIGAQSVLLVLLLMLDVAVCVGASGRAKERREAIVLLGLLNVVLVLAGAFDQIVGWPPQ